MANNDRISTKVVFFILLLLLLTNIFLSYNFLNKNSSLSYNNSIHNYLNSKQYANTNSVLTKIPTLLPNNSIIYESRFIGPLNPSKVLNVTFLLPYQYSAELSNYIQYLYNTPVNERNYLTPAQFNIHFGINPSFKNMLISYLKQFNINSTSSDTSFLVSAKGTVKNFEKALNIKLNLYWYNSITFFTANSSISLPRYLSSIELVYGLENLTELKAVPFIKVLTNIKSLQNPDQTTGELSFYVPSEIMKIYNVTPLIKAGFNGSKETIAIVDAYGNPYIQQELNLFDQQFNLPNTTLNIYCIDGPCNGTLGIMNGWAGEISLDVEWAHATAPGATIDLYLAGSDNDTAMYDAVQAAVNNPSVSVISLSWGISEKFITASGLYSYSGNGLQYNFPWLDQVFQQAAAEGITVFASSGDNGAYELNYGYSDPFGGASYPATDPYVTSVGGTSLYMNTVSGGYNNLTVNINASYGYETAWSWNNYYGWGTGGGYSVLFNRPYWQYGTGISNNSLRGVPDVAWDADPLTGVVINTVIAQCNAITCTNIQQTFEVIGGTSYGAPSWAAITALFDQKAGHKLGFINPALYSILRNQTEYSKAFHDITQGNNDPYQATQGWDPLTGLGSPNVGELAIFITNTGTLNVLVKTYQLFANNAPPLSIVGSDIFSDSVYDPKTGYLYGYYPNNYTPHGVYFSFDVYNPINKSYIASFPTNCQLLYNLTLVNNTIYLTCYNGLYTFNVNNYTADTYSLSVPAIRWTIIPLQVEYNSQSNYIYILNPFSLYVVDLKTQSIISNITIVKNSYLNGSLVHTLTSISFSNNTIFISEYNAPSNSVIINSSNTNSSLIIMNQTNFKILSNITLLHEAFIQGMYFYSRENSLYFTVDSINSTYVALYNNTLGKITKTISLNNWFTVADFESIYLLSYDNVNTRVITNCNSNQIYGCNMLFILQGDVTALINLTSFTVYKVLLTPYDFWLSATSFTFDNNNNYIYAGPVIFGPQNNTSNYWYTSTVKIVANLYSTNGTVLTQGSLLANITDSNNHIVASNIPLSYNSTINSWIGYYKIQNNEAAGEWQILVKATSGNQFGFGYNTITVGDSITSLSNFYGPSNGYFIGYNDSIVGSFIILDPSNSIVTNGSFNVLINLNNPQGPLQANLTLRFMPCNDITPLSCSWYFNYTVNYNNNSEGWWITTIEGKDVNNKLASVYNYIYIGADVTPFTDSPNYVLGDTINIYAFESIGFPSNQTCFPSYALISENSKLIANVSLSNSVNMGLKTLCEGNFTLNSNYPTGYYNITVFAKHVDYRYGSFVSNNNYGYGTTFVHVGMRNIEVNVTLSKPVASILNTSSEEIFANVHYNNGTILYISSVTASIYLNLPNNTSIQVNSIFLIYNQHDKMFIGNLSLNGLVGNFTVYVLAIDPFGNLGDNYTNLIVNALSTNKTIYSPGIVKYTLNLLNQSIEPGNVLPYDGICSTSVAFDNFKNDLYVPNWCTQNVLIVNESNGIILKSIPAYGLAVSLPHVGYYYSQAIDDPKDHFIYITQPYTFSVLIIDAKNNYVVDDISLIRIINYLQYTFESYCIPNSLAYDSNTSSIYVGCTLVDVNKNLITYGFGSLYVIQGTTITDFTYFELNYTSKLLNNPTYSITIDNQDRVLFYLDSESCPHYINLTQIRNGYIVANSSDIYPSCQSTFNMTNKQYDQLGFEQIIYTDNGLYGLGIYQSTTSGVEGNETYGIAFIGDFNATGDFNYAPPSNLTFLPKSSLPDPTGMAYDSNNEGIYIADQLYCSEFYHCFGNLDLVNSTNNTFVKSIHLPAERPVSPTVDLDNGYIIVPCPGTGTLVFVNETDNTVIANYQLIIQIRGLAYDPNTGSIYGTDSEVGQIFVFDALNNSLVYIANTTYPFPIGITVDYYDGYIYVSHPFNSTITVYNDTSFASVANITTGFESNPSSLLYDPNNNLVYYVDSYHGIVGIINPKTNKIIGNVSTGIIYNGLYFEDSITLDTKNNLIYVVGDSKNVICSQNSVCYNKGLISVINASSNTLITQINLGISPGQILYDSLNNFVYYASTYEGKVYVFNASSYKVIGQIYVGKPVEGLILDIQNGYVYATDLNFGALNGEVSVIDGQIIIGNIAVGDYPFLGLFDPENNYVYISNLYSSSISIISSSSYLHKITFDACPYYPNCPFNLNEIWSVNLNGTVVSSFIGSNITFAVYNGIYDYTYYIGNTPIPNTYHYKVVVDNNDTVIDLLFYSIAFIENGLSNSTVWSVNFDNFISCSSIETSDICYNTTTVFGGHTVISITFPAGNYPFVIVPPKGYKANPAQGIVNTNNFTTLSNLINFTTINYYNLTFNEKGLPYGTTWSIILNNTNYSTSKTSMTINLPSGNYYYIVKNITGYSVYPNSGNIDLTSNRVINVTFSKLASYYSLTFTEQGLPSGTSWSVTVNGTTKSSSTSTITFTISSAYYTYSVGSVLGYKSNITTGSINLISNTTINIKFTPITYTLTFTEQGLPSGTTWSVTVNGTTKSSSSNSIVFALPYGYYHYSVSSVSGYTPSPMTGSITLSSNATINITFSKIEYSLTFTEQGLPTGTSWSVTVNGTTLTSTTSSITFTLTPGYYSYTIGTVSGYNSNVTSGNVNLVANTVYKH